MQTPSIDIYGNEYDTFENIPEGAVFDELDLFSTELTEKLTTLTVRKLKFIQLLNDCDDTDTDIPLFSVLPKGLKELDCSEASITSLKGLPEGLEKLDCRETNITSLEGLP